MDRRSLFRASGVAAGLGLTSVLAPTAALASSSPDSSEDAFAFVTDDMTTEEVADLLFEGAPQAERDAYVELVEDKYADLSPREQLRNAVIEDEADESDVTPAAVPLIPIAAKIAARALVAAAKRYGPSIYRSLRNAVAKGYNSFKAWTNEHQFASGVLAGVTGSAVFAALQEIFGLG